MHHNHEERDWVYCTLCRSYEQGVATLQRASRRKVIWPEPKKYGGNPIQDPIKYTSIDDAFSSILDYISTTTKKCKGYYATSCPSMKDPNDKMHCTRFHDSQKYTKALHSNPLQRSEDVHLVVHPGTYAVTTGEWGTKQQQTHVVQVDPGQSVNLDFVL